MKYINISVSSEFHQKIKVRAAEEGVSMTSLVNKLMGNGLLPIRLQDDPEKKPQNDFPHQVLKEKVMDDISKFKMCSHGAKVGLCKRGCK